MDPGRFDALTRSLAMPKSRRGFLAGAVAFAAAAASGLRGGAQNGCPPGQTPNRKGDCSCPAGTDPCPNGCFDRRRDVNNCGSCGNVCATGAVCIKGECRCPSGTVECEGFCRTQASFADDPNNCAGCGVVCPQGAPGTCQGASICTAGACGFAYAGSETVCRPAMNDCDLAEFCSGSSLDCPEDAKAIDGAACNADGDACTVGDSCLAGVCQPGLPRECRPCQTCVGGDCVAVTADVRCPAGCCGEICCRDDELCVQGVCQPQNCVAAGGACTATDTCCGSTACSPDGICGGLAAECLDDDDCAGTIGCGFGDRCGYLGATCETRDDCNGDDRKACCNGSCTNTSTDKFNCGTCGTVCPAFEICDGSEGRCAGDYCDDTLPCANGMDCGSDNHCGGLEAECLTDDDCSGTIGCGLGDRCGYRGASCATRDDCNGDDAKACCNGSCTSLATDAFNCGTCGFICPADHICNGVPATCTGDYCDESLPCEDGRDCGSNNTCGGLGAQCLNDDDCTGTFGCGAGNQCE